MIVEDHKGYRDRYHAIMVKASMFHNDVAGRYLTVVPAAASEDFQGAKDWCTAQGLPANHDCFPTQIDTPAVSADTTASSSG